MMGNSCGRQNSYRHKPTGTPPEEPRSHISRAILCSCREHHTATSGHEAYLPCVCLQCSARVSMAATCPACSLLSSGAVVSA